MGRRGPAKRPTTLRLVEGARPDKVNQAEPKPVPVSPEPPDHLSTDVREVWDYTLGQLERMHIAFASDRDALVAYCEAVVMHRRASIALAGVGMEGELLMPGANSGWVRNPIAQMQRDSAALIRAFAQEFGLTPSARASIKSEKPADNAGNPFAPAGDS